MLLVIPVSKADASLIPNVVRAFEINPPGRDHTLLVVSTHDASDEANTLIDGIQRHFTSSTLHVLSPKADEGWPRSMNSLFQQTVYKVATLIPENQGWFWHELDTVPLANNWLSTIETAYYADANESVKEGRGIYRFLGVKDATVKAQNGELLPLEKAGSHMAAVGVYPSNFVDLVPIVPALTGGRDPFYVRAQWYVLKLLNVSPLIQNNWRTVNYRLDGDEIVCDSHANWAWDIHYNNPISKDALIIHGVKDSSLVDLLGNNKPSQDATQTECSIPTLYSNTPDVTDKTPALLEMVGGTQVYIPMSECPSEPAKEHLPVVEKSDDSSVISDEKFQRIEKKTRGKAKRRKQSKASKTKKAREYIKKYRAKRKLMLQAETDSQQPTNTDA